MLINFTKMHALGNDFVIVDQIRQQVRFNTAEIKRIADRKFGIGCDQVLLLEPPINPHSVCYVRIFNQNGHEAAQCANGMRAAAMYAVDSGLTNKLDFTIQCQAGMYRAFIRNDNFITMELLNLKVNIKEYTTTLFDQIITLHGVSLGNSHVICKLESLIGIQVDKYAIKIAENNQLPANSNVSFMQVVTNKHIILRVFENGVGETLACGSAACAAVIVGNSLGILDAETTVSFVHGDLDIVYIKGENILKISGPATSVFFGSFRI
jgi:diaminopimelate epimerase